MGPFDDHILVQEVRRIFDLFVFLERNIVGKSWKMCPPFNRYGKVLTVDKPFMGKCLEDFFQNGNPG